MQHTETQWSVPFSPFNPGCISFTHPSKFCDAIYAFSFVTDHAWPQLYQKSPSHLGCVDKWRLVVPCPPMLSSFLFYFFKFYIMHNVASSALCFICKSVLQSCLLWGGHRVVYFDQLGVKSSIMPTLRWSSSLIQKMKRNLCFHVTITFSSDESSDCTGSVVSLWS